MEIRRIHDMLSVAGQIDAEDVQAIVDAGFKSILCNRPDNEGMNQPEFASVEAAAKQAGIQIIYQPVISSAIRDMDIDDFAKAYEALPKPVLAYCRTGTRCTALWSLSQAGTRDLEEILNMAADAGYNMAGLAGRIADRT